VDISHICSEPLGLLGCSDADEVDVDLFNEGIVGGEGKAARLQL
jgi:hypothetical protein